MYVPAFPASLACRMISTVNLLRLLGSCLSQQPPPIFRFPLLQVNLAALNPWKRDDLTDAETVLSDWIEQTPHPSHFALANRALIRTRSKRWDMAIQDARMSLQVKLSPIGHIALALALIGQGEQELALQEFDLVFRDCEPNDNSFLLLIKSILVFICSKHDNAISRTLSLISTRGDTTTNCYHQVLAYMYLEKGEDELALRATKSAPLQSSPYEDHHLTTISLISGWSFDGLGSVAQQRLCEVLFSARRMKEPMETLQRMVNALNNPNKGGCDGHILEEIITNSGEVSALAWVGKSSSYNSSLPDSLSSYSQAPFIPQSLEGVEMEQRTEKLREIFSHLDAVLIYDRVIRLPEIRFANRRLHLPCLVFPVKGLSSNRKNLYGARASGIGSVEFTTEDPLPLMEPHRLVFANPWIHDILGSYDNVDYSETETEDTDTDMTEESVDSSLAEEDPKDVYSRALQLIARLGQSFSMFLLLRQPDGSFIRVASENEIVSPGLGIKVPKNIHAEVLEIQ